MRGDGPCTKYSSPFHSFLVRQCSCIASEHRTSVTRQLGKHECKRYALLVRCHGSIQENIPIKQLVTCKAPTPVDAVDARMLDNSELELAPIR